MDGRPQDDIFRPIFPGVIVFVLVTLAAIIWGIVEGDDVPGTWETALLGTVFGLLGVLASWWEAGNWHFVIRQNEPFLVRSWPRLELAANEAESIFYWPKRYYRLTGHPKKKRKVVMLYGIPKRRQAELAEAFEAIADGPNGTHMAVVGGRRE